jgi:hypothetical protein
MMLEATVCKSHDQRGFITPFLFFQIFQAVEHPFEESKLTELQTLVILERENFVRFIFNGSWNSVVHRENIDNKLLEYEQTVSVAAQEGIDLKTKECIYQWSYIQSVFFASTILTTIGRKIPFFKRYWT